MSAARATGILAVFLVVLTGCKPATAPSLPEANVVNAGCNLPTTAPGPTADFTAFANYSWLLFQAVNWPVGSSRGVPDCRKPIGTNGTTVWESYKTVEQIFLPNAADPGPWNDGAVGAMRLTFRSKAPEQLPLEPRSRRPSAAG